MYGFPQPLGRMRMQFKSLVCFIIDQSLSFNQELAELTVVEEGGSETVNPLSPGFDPRLKVRASYQLRKEE